MSKLRVITDDLVDNAFDSTSTNPVQNKVIKEALETKINSKYDVSLAGKFLKIAETGDVVAGDSGALPSAVSDGTAVVYIDGEWKIQEGYGFEKIDSEGTPSVTKIDKKFIPDVYDSSMDEGKVYVQGSDGVATGVTIDNLQSDNLTTTNKKIVSAINEQKQIIDGITGGVRIEVVDELPESPINNTIYYVKQAGVEPTVYTIKMYTGGAYIDLGTTQIDMTVYAKKADIVDNLTTNDGSKMLSAKQGKLLNDRKLNLSGGTMTGRIVLPTGNMNGIGVSSNNGYLDIDGGNSNQNGGNLTLFGESYQDDAMRGAFRLGTGENGNNHWFIGKKNGYLYWDNNEVLTQAYVIDNLTSVANKNPLSAKQGKVLNDTKLNKTDVINNLTTTTTNQALSANMGKTLNDGLYSIDVGNFKAQATTEAGKVFGVNADGSVGLISGGGGVEVIDNLTTQDATKALSANQGFVLKGLIDAIPSHTSKYLHHITLSTSAFDWFISFQFVNTEKNDYSSRDEVAGALYSLGHESKQFVHTATGWLQPESTRYIILGVGGTSTNLLKFYGVPTNEYGSVYDELPSQFTYLIDNVTAL